MQLINFFLARGLYYIQVNSSFLGASSSKIVGFLNASKDLVLKIKFFSKKCAEKAHFELGPRLESPRFEWTRKQANCYKTSIIYI